MAAGDAQRPSLDKFVAKVVPDPANPPDAAVMQGFIGASDAADHIRVYADPSLSSFVDVPADAVLHHEKLPAAQSPLGGSTVWVKRSAPVRTPAPPAPQATAAEFLRGSVQAALGPVTAGLGCPSTSTCPSFGIACTYVSCPPQTSLMFCPSSSTCPPTHLLGCPDSRVCSPHTSADGCPNTSTCAAIPFSGPQCMSQGHCFTMGCNEPAVAQAAMPPSMVPACLSAQYCSTQYCVAPALAQQTPGSMGCTFIFPSVCGC